MDLWVRNQNKSGIIKVSNIFIDDEGKKICSMLEEEVFVLGKYKSKKRTLEILDEIQQILTPRIICSPPELNNMYDVPKVVEYVRYESDRKTIEQIKYCVYQMPKE